VSVT
ncbi:hypothetical protein CP02DC15_0016B, partial [Chlamydia psittaci 02DC15]|jgi:hypothetical protein